MMLKLNHANIPVNDVTGLRTFFEAYFGFRAVLVRGDAFAVLSGEDGFALNLMRSSAEVSSLPENFHVGFLVESADVVHAKHAALAAGGFAPGPVEQVTRGGQTSITFYCNAPGGLLVEVSHSFA